MYGKGERERERERKRERERERERQEDSRRRRIKKETHTEYNKWWKATKHAWDQKSSLFENVPFFLSFGRWRDSNDDDSMVCVRMKEGLTRLQGFILAAQMLAVKKKECDSLMHHLEPPDPFACYPSVVNE